MEDLSSVMNNIAYLNTMNETHMAFQIDDWYSFLRHVMTPTFNEPMMRRIFGDQNYMVPFNPCDIINDQWSMLVFSHNSSRAHIGCDKEYWMSRFRHPKNIIPLVFGTQFAIVMNVDETMDYIRATHNNYSKYINRKSDGGNIWDLNYQRSMNALMRIKES